MRGQADPTTPTFTALSPDLDMVYFLCLSCHDHGMLQFVNGNVHYRLNKIIVYFCAATLLGLRKWIRVFCIKWAAVATV